MAKYRVQRKRIRFSASRNPDSEDALDSTVYEPGDVIENPPEEVLDSFSDRLSKVDEVPVVPDSELPDLYEYTVAEVEELLEGGAYDGVLDALEEQEAENDDRQGVYDAIEERR